MKMSVDKLPRKVLVNAVNLRDPYRIVYLALAKHGEPATAKAIADKIGYTRAPVHARLLELVDRGLVQSWKKGRTRMFEVVLENEVHRTLGLEGLPDEDLAEKLEGGAVKE